jgi:hypothetical protein
MPSADRSARHHINALTQLLKYIPRSIVNAAALERKHDSNRVCSCLRSRRNVAA